MFRYVGKFLFYNSYSIGLNNVPEAVEVKAKLLIFHTILF